MTREPPARYEVPEPPKLKKSTVIKIGIVVILVLLAYWLWKVFIHLPPAHPLQYPADYRPNTPVPPEITALLVPLEMVPKLGKVLNSVSECQRCW